MWRDFVDPNHDKLSALNIKFNNSILSSFIALLMETMHDLGQHDTLLRC